MPWHVRIPKYAHAGCDGHAPACPYDNKKVPPDDARRDFFIVDYAG